MKIPDYERQVLENGLVVYLLEDGKWPLVEGRVMIRTGGAFEPADKVGLASVTGPAAGDGAGRTRRGTHRWRQASIGGRF
mgnify:CR=1 FL=1